MLEMSFWSYIHNPISQSRREIMITNFGLYFESTDKNDFFGTITRALHIYHGGKVTLLTRRGTRHENVTEYNSIAEFIAANPVIAKEIINWCRENKINLDSMISSKGTDMVPITKNCKKCGKEKGIGEFPKNDLTFDGRHGDCCECRISECQRIKAYCATPGQEQCRTCPVRTPMDVIK
jgi:hypothetical protein